MANYSDIRYAVTGTDVYSDITDLPLSGVDTGTQAFVSGSNRLYMWTGTGWYNIALINTNPSLSGAASSYTLSNEGANTVVTLSSTDPEGLPISFTVSHSGLGVGANAIATVTQSNNIFTFTPTTNTALAGTFTSTFTASDGVNVAVANSSFTLAFAVNNSNYTTALITSVGANNADNNDISDSSTNSHTITVNGSVTQNTFSPYRHGGYSTYFDGSGDYLQVPQAAAARGTGDYTIECWVYSKTFANEKFIFDARSAASPIDDFMTINSSGYLFFRSNGTTTTTTQQMSVNTWHHFAQVRNGSTLKVYVDGVEVASKTQSGNLSIASAFDIGGSSNDGASATIDGYISDFRIVLGTAVYTSAFTPPTERLTAITNTSLLTCHLPYFADGSTNGHSITVNGNTKTEPFAPYDYIETYSASTHGGSAYFSGINGDLENQLDLGAARIPATGDFTFETWVNAEPKTGSNHVLISQYLNSQSGRFQFVIGSSDHGSAPNGLIISTTFLSLYGSAVVADNSWHHVVLEREGNVWRMYVDGVLDTTATASGSVYTGRNTRIGNTINTAGAHNPLQGYLSDCRLTTSAVYGGSSYTIPSTPVSAITNTSILLNFQDAGIIDKSQSVKTITLNGDVKSSTTQTKYLSSSMYFDGTGDYIEVADTLGEFTNYSNATLEMWVYPTSSSGEQNLIEKFTPGSGPGWTLYTTSGTLNLQWYGGGTTNSSTAMTINQWNHVAVVHNNGTRKIYINGTGGTGVSLSSTVSSNPLRIGTRGTTGSFFNGYMSDIRIQLGLARYTANFTPPTAALQG